jgi:hypothetical protein
MADEDSRQQKGEEPQSRRAPIVPQIDSPSSPNVGAGDPTDGREPFDWRTHYPAEALKEIRWERVYLFLLLFFSYFVIIASWKGWVCCLLFTSPAEAATLKKYSYYGGSGMLGGVAFGIKYFYRVVARGYWHQDRKTWRLMSPFLATTLALVVGALIDSGLITTRGPSSGPAFLSIGFLVGYFADQAIAKMGEIAIVLFGASATTKADSRK